MVFFFLAVKTKIYLHLHGKKYEFAINLLLCHFLTCIIYNNNFITNEMIFIFGLAKKDSTKEMSIQIHFVDNLRCNH